MLKFGNRSLVVMSDAASPADLAPYVRRLPRLFELDIANAVDSEVALAKAIPGLTHFRAVKGRLTDFGFAALAENAGLLSVNVEGNAKITSGGALHLRLLSDLSSLNLSGTAIDDSGLNVLKRLSRLTSLNLSATHVTNRGLENLRSLRELDSLNLSNTHVGNGGLKDLSVLSSMGYLNLDSTKVTDAGVLALTGMTRLRFVSFQHTTVTTEGVRPLRALNSNIRIVVGDGEPAFSLPGAPALVPLPAKNVVVAPVQPPHEHREQSGPAEIATPPVAADERDVISFLEKHTVNVLVQNGHVDMVIVNADKADPAKIAPYLRRLKHVTSVRFFGMFNADAHLALVKVVPSVKRVEIAGIQLADKAGSGRVTDEGLASLENATELVTLDLELNPKITGSGLRHLRKLKKLSTLNLSNTSVGDDGLDNLRALESLHDLDLSRHEGHGPWNGFSWGA